MHHGKRLKINHVRGVTRRILRVLTRVTGGAKRTLIMRFIPLWTVAAFNDIEVISRISKREPGRATQILTRPELASTVFHLIAGLIRHNVNQFNVNRHFSTNVIH